MKHSIYRHTISFGVMLLVGLIFNPMNILAYRTDDLYLSLTLIYSGLLMASNMIWAHEVSHYVSMGHLNIHLFCFGIILSVIISTLLLRGQLFITSDQWLRRMIGHHSTAITTTTELLKNNDNFEENQKVYRFAKDIIYNQEKEILYMKSMI